MTWCNISVFLLAFAQVCLTDDAPLIKVNQGLLQGNVKTTRGGRTFFSFQGIPYAEPPVGDLRFEEPLPGKPWEGVLDATKEHVKCVQKDIFYRNETVDGDENCLYLNVFTPKISETELLPVIFYIHGGGFVKGSAKSSLWGPYLMLDKDLVLVTANYRLGPFGFLSTSDNIVPGNNGLKDQNLALKWVKNNIQQFGGDPKRITISGQSAGGSSAYYHMLSPLSKDLFYAGISASGITPALWSLGQQGEARKNAMRLAELLNCPTNCTKTMIECMKAVPAYKIIEKIINFRVFHYDPVIPFKPVIEPYSKNAFLYEHPYQIIKSGKMAQVPFMTSITTDDGALKSAAVYHNHSAIKKLELNYKKYLPYFLHYDELNCDADNISKAIMEFYFKEKNINNDTKAELTDVVTDALFLVPARTTSVLHAKYSTKPVYFYLFGYKGATSFSKLFGDPEHDYGVCHCDDMLYLMTNSFLPYTPSLEDIKMTNIMTTFWYNFASTGNPNTNSLISAKWDPVVSSDLEYLFIKDTRTFEMRKNLFEERFQFWANLLQRNEEDKIKNELENS